jgi:hypothetical protein
MKKQIACNKLSAMKKVNYSSGSKLVAVSVAVLLAIAGSLDRVNASGINLGSAADYGILGLDGSIINLSSGPLRVNANVGVGDNGTLNFSGGGQINGRVDHSASATLNTGGNTITGGTDQIDFSGIQSDVQNLVTSLNSLSPTETLSSITNPTTLTSTGSQNVVSVTGDIHLSGGNLTLSGAPGDVFVFKIGGTMELSGNTNIVLTGGLTANDVVWDFLGSGSQFQTSGQSDTAGIFLAPDRVININGGVHESEFISGETLSFQSNPVINPIPVPEVIPSWMTLSVIGLIMTIGSRFVRQSGAPVP